MSHYDVSRLTGASAIRGAARELPGAKASPSAPQGALAAEPGVAVETRNRVSAGAVPVDDARVDTIRQALRDGSYPIVPAKITDAIIAARLMLTSGERA